MEEIQFPLKLTELHIRNFMTVDSVDLTFQHNCTAICNEENFVNDDQSILITAIKFIVGKEYLYGPKAKTLERKNSSIRGFVKLVFKYIDDGFYGRFFDVWRTFNDINTIYYRQHNVQKMLPIQIFQREFKLKAFSSHLNYDAETNYENNNILHFLDRPAEIIAKEMDDISDLLDQTNITLDDKVLATSDNLLEITNFEYHYVWKTFDIMTEIVNEIFKKLTCDNYEVYFVKTRLEYLEGLDRFDIKTIVRNCFDQTELLWTKAENYLKYLLKISVQIGVAIHFKHKFMCIKISDWVNDNQNFNNFISEIIMEHFDDIHAVIGEEINYLEKIIEICNQNNIIGIFEYKNVLNLNNCNIINCKIENGVPNYENVENEPNVIHNN